MQLELITHTPTSDPRPTPILFVHGAWHGAWCWEDYFLPYFAQCGYVSYALSWRGHGKSEGREKLWRTRASGYVADIAQVVEQIGKPSVLVGHSMGGYIVQKYLESRDAPAAVLLASLPAAGMIRLVLKWMRHQPLDLLKTTVTWNAYPLVGSLDRAHQAFFSPDMSGPQVERYFQYIQGESFWAGQDATWLNLPRPRKVKTPMLVLGGTSDTIFSRSEVEATAHAYHTTAEFFDMAHDMMLERGWQAVAHRIIQWLGERGL